MLLCVVHVTAHVADQEFLQIVVMNDRQHFLECALVVRFGQWFLYCQLDTLARRHLARLHHSPDHSLVDLLDQALRVAKMHLELCLFLHSPAQ